MHKLILHSLLLLQLSAWTSAQDPMPHAEAPLASQGPASLLGQQTLQPQESFGQDPQPRRGLDGKRQDGTQEDGFLDDPELALLRRKALEKGPKRFGEDLFGFRHRETGVTEGGISDDYVIGVGDHLHLGLFGSITLEVPLVVDGRGTVLVPRVGTIPVAGMSLGRARAVAEARVRQVFSRAVVDLSVTKLREVRVFVLGEVYRPGGYLVPNLTSIINVLGLAGGPTHAGSFRRIKVVRGGAAVRVVDLYPLRSEGVGNINIGFQNGDTVFVPLLENQVRLEGAFTRVVASAPEGPDTLTPPDTEEQKELKRQIRRLELNLGVPSSLGEPGEPALPNGGPAFVVSKEFPPKEARLLSPGTGNNEPPAPAAPGAALMHPLHGTQPIGPEQRSLLEESLDFLKEQLRVSRFKARGDKRIPKDAGMDEDSGQPPWVRRWLQEGVAPVMLFEMCPGETVKDALAFAGGFALRTFSASVSLKRIDASGAVEVQTIPAGEGMAKTVLERGDVLTALPLRDARERQVSVSGWTRIQGVFARTDGMRVGDLLRTFELVLPDTYLGRGEIVRTSAQEVRQYLAFDVAKALASDPGHNLELRDRDEVELYRLGDLRLPRTLTVVGPVEKPGIYEFLEGMRASDLLFRAGVPLLGADRYVGEVAHFRDGKFGEVRRLDLTRLLSSEGGSPVDLKDDVLNPRLEPFDQLSVYAKPDFRQHRVVTLSGQVVRPGTYELDAPGETLRDVLARAGGLTPDAMPSAGIFLRNLVKIDKDKARAAARSNSGTDDPTSNEINEILQRLNETKRLPLTGALLSDPLLHGVTAGNLNRLVVDFPRLLAGDSGAEVELQDGDEVIFPRKTDVAYVVGETASPFGAYKVAKGMTVKDILTLAGGPTRNADTGNVRLLKADGRIVDRRVASKNIEPGDALLVPQRIRRDVSWQENLSAITPLAVLINALRN